jgi:hypothetical protein
LTSLRELDYFRDPHRIGIAAIDHYFNPAPGRRRAPVIELTGTTPGSGKTQLLYHIATLALRPRSRDGASAGDGDGEGAVVWLDPEGRLDILRLHSMLQQQIRQSVPQTPPSDGNPRPDGATAGTLAGRAAQALQHLHVFQPQSTPALIATLLHLTDYDFDIRTCCSAARPLRTLVLSNLSAFLWQDRQDDVSRVSADGASAPASNLFVQRHRDIVAALRQVQRRFACAVVLSNTTFSPPHVSPGVGLALRPHLPAVWYQFVDLRLVVSRNASAKFRPGISAEEALLEEESRRATAGDGEFLAQMNRWTPEGGNSSGVRTGLAGDVKFHFTVTDVGVAIL